MTFKYVAMLMALVSVAGSAAFGAVAVSPETPPVAVFPNPWRADRPSANITFSKVPANASIKIFTVSGRLVREIRADSTGQGFWDRMNDSGDLVASGVYLYLVADGEGHHTKGKLAIIR